jgi:hypothetical protein
MNAPLTVNLADFAQLRLIAWNRAPNDTVPEDEALALYERNWRFVDQDSLTQAESQLIARLVAQYGGGVLHV